MQTANEVSGHPLTPFPSPQGEGDRSRAPSERSVAVTEVEVRSVLTRSGGYLNGVASHSLQPYRGCTYGNSLCGVGCYVRHSGHITRGRAWGSFLEVRTTAADVYRATCERERKWARGRAAGVGNRFVIFCSSATDPFVPQERRFRVTRSMLEAMLEHPPDGLILQTHSHRVLDELDRIRELSRKCDVRVHVSIESDRDRLPGLPPPGSSVEKRLAACATLRGAGVRTVVTVAPLLPIAEPERFFTRIAEVADAVVLDHFVGGDGTPTGHRTRRTGLPVAMAHVNPKSVEPGYLDEMAAIARRILPGRVGVGQRGFAAQFS
jgi:DNA repair photolyase